MLSEFNCFIILKKQTFFIQTYSKSIKRDAMLYAVLKHDSWSQSSVIIDSRVSTHVEIPL